MRAQQKVLLPLALAGVVLAGWLATTSGDPETAVRAEPVAEAPAAVNRSTPPDVGVPLDQPHGGAYAARGTDGAGHSYPGRCIRNPGEEPVLATIRLDHRPVDLALDARDSALYTSSERGQTVSVMDTRSRTLVSAIDLRDRPYGLLLDEHRGALYATLAGPRVPGGAIAVVDTASRELVRSIRFPDARWPTDGALDPGTGLLFVVNSGDDSVAVFDSVSGDRVRRIPVDVDPIFVDVVSESGLVLVSGAKGLAAIDIGTLEVRNILRIPAGALAIDHEDGGVYVANQGFGTLTVVDLAAFDVVGRVPVGGRGPFDVAFDSAAGLAYVTGAADGNLVIVDMASLRIVERIGGADGSHAWYGAVAVDHAKNCVYVADLERDAIAVIARR